MGKQATSETVYRTSVCELYVDFDDPVQLISSIHHFAFVRAFSRQVCTIDNHA